MNEIWKDISGYEGYYQVSSLGRVKRLERIESVFEKGKYIKKKIPACIKSSKTNSHNYQSLLLSKDNKPKRFYVHRLVAEAFIDKVQDKPQVNHINGNKKDNRMENLEWCDYRDNTIHSLSIGLSKQKGETHFNSKKVINLINGEIYSSILDASNKNNIKYSLLKQKLSGKCFNNTHLRYYPNQATVIPMRQIPRLDPAQIAAQLKSHITISVK